MNNETQTQTDAPHLDLTTVTQALSGSCDIREKDCFPSGIECTDEECFITTNEFEMVSSS